MASSHSLIFIHGWGTDSSVWKKQMSYFSKRHKIETPEIYKLPTPNSQLPTILIGWSYGGMLSIEKAAEKPEDFKALVLVGSTAKFVDEINGMHPVAAKKLKRALEKDFENAMKNCYRVFFSKKENNFTHEFIDKQILPDKKSTIDMLEKLMNMDIRENLKNINIPTLIIHGDEDGVCPVEAGKFLKNGLKDSRIKIIKGAGHMPFYTRPDEFNKILEDFIVNDK